MGDSRGIGPEVIVHTLSDRSIRRLADFLVIGDLHCIKRVNRLLKASMPLHEVNLWELINSKKAVIDNKAINILNLGAKDKGRDPLRYIDTALMLIKRGRASALVTAPVNKESITRSGVKFSGHTEYLARLTGTKRIAMMFVGGRLRVTVVTRHIPLKRVASALTKAKITDAAILTHRFLRERFGMKRPRIGILALNPHAGEGGTIGRDEIDTIRPAVRSLKRKIPAVSGPIPADSAFNLLYNGGLECLIAMYHDQAMIPVKTFARESCVNVTLGLPFVRTSPVHGTAYDIAGKGIADPSSMKEATRLACRLISV
ncbi:4-hydroxythreonine-4-phosphate dehydrogenase PdxA [Omnitrophica bacterium]|nr:4-hydroxythreonine-4-phosphate dehydrogenase PdxA [Candidatus Omnitrophota bacterium]